MEAGPAEGALVPYDELSAWVDWYWRQPPQVQGRALGGILAFSPLPQLRLLSQSLEPFLKRDIISDLPLEVAAHVLSFLQPPDIANAAGVCQSWRRVAWDKGLWKKMLRRGEVRPEIVARTGLFRQLFGASTSPRDIFGAAELIRRRWENGECSITFMPAHKDHVITCLQFDDEKIVSASDDGTLRAWDVRTGKELRTFVGHAGGVWCLKFADNIIVSGATDRTLRVWDANTGECLSVLTGHTSTVRCLDFEDNVIVSGSRDTHIRVWSLHGPGSDRAKFVMQGHTNSVRCIVLKNGLCASGSYDNTVRLWRVATGELLRTMSGHTNKIYSLEFDGTYIVSGSLDNNIRVWDASSGEQVHNLRGHQSLVGLMQLRKNILVSGNADNDLRVWDIHSGQCVKTLIGHQSAVTCVQFDDDKVVSGSDDGTIKVWSCQSGKALHTPLQLGERGVVWRLQFDETKIVAAVRRPRESVDGETCLVILDFASAEDNGVPLSDAGSMHDMWQFDSSDISMQKSQEDSPMEMSSDAGMSVPPFDRLRPSRRTHLLWVDGASGRIFACQNPS